MFIILGFCLVSVFFLTIWLPTVMRYMDNSFFLLDLYEWFRIFDEQGLAGMNRWFESNGVHINIGKTKVILFPSVCHDLCK